MTSNILKHVDNLINIQNVWVLHAGAVISIECMRIDGTIRAEPYAAIMRLLRLERVAVKAEKDKEERERREGGNPDKRERISLCSDRIFIA